MISPVGCGARGGTAVRSNSIAVGAGALLAPTSGVQAAASGASITTSVDRMRAPQPTGLIINPGTGKIDFALAGTPLPEDCSTQQVLTQAQCQFGQWLQTLNGFPTVTT